jgi:hypothetical protein
MGDFSYFRPFAQIRRNPSPIGISGLFCAQTVARISGSAGGLCSPPVAQNPEQAPQMADKRLLTDRFLRALPPASRGKGDEVWDSRVTGFGVRVSTRVLTERLYGFSKARSLLIIASSRTG